MAPFGALFCFLRSGIVWVGFGRERVFNSYLGLSGGVFIWFGLECRDFFHALVGFLAFV